MTKTNKIEKFKVYIERGIYKNGDFRIYAGSLENGDEISIKSDGIELNEGNHCLVGIMGSYQGKKSFLLKYEDIDENNKEAQKNILKSIPGIKQSTADLICNNIDDINIYRTDDYPKIKGIGPAKIELIREGLQLLDNMIIFKELNIMLGAKVSNKQIKKINGVLEELDDGLNRFKENPYEILIDHIGLGFKKSDQIALGMDANFTLSDIRKLYLIEYLVKFYTSMGNCYIEKGALKEKLESVGNFTMENIENNKRLVIDEDKVYTLSMHKAESLIPHKINEIISKKIDKRRLYTYNIDTMINDFQELNKIKFDEYQLKAIHTAVNNPVSILTGGAGTGKTTLLKCVLYCLGETGFNCFLTAPTGKAARRMEQSTGIEARTIHKFISKAEEEYSRRNCVMVIDEFSMVDTELLYTLLKSMDESSLDFNKIIFVGDPGQLPSVQPGNCLHDMLESKTLPSIKLEKTFRQKGGSNIIDIATKVRHNELFDPIKKSDFYVREVKNENEYQGLVKYFFNYLYEKYNDIDSFYSEVQFIAPMKKGSAGVIKINEIIKNLINPSTRTEKERKFFPFDVNDKIMNTKNDSLNSIMNGEFGRLTEVTETNFTIYYKDLDKVVTYKKESDVVSNFQLSYCSTVHKLQGSEFKYIVLIIPQDSLFLDSRLLYTGITRGKQTVILLTDKKTCDKVTTRNNLLKRNTNLKNRMIEVLGNADNNI
jgi:exodeoxyribonuclease V alpha subunit